MIINRKSKVSLRRSTDMTPKKKAFELIKVTFELIANATNYKGIKNGDDQMFGQIEAIAKKVAKTFVKEIITESEKYEFGHPILLGERKEFWQNVLSEIDAM